MSKFFDDTMQGLLEAVAIEKGDIPVEKSMQDSNSQYKEKKEAFSKLEQLRKKGIVNDDAELAAYRENKYGKDYLKL